MAACTFELTPTAFLRRSVEVYAARKAVLDGDLRIGNRELLERCHAVTGVLRRWGIEPGDRVAVLARSSQLLLEMAHAAPMRGAVLVRLTEEFTTVGAKVAAAVGRTGAAGRAVVASAVVGQPDERSGEGPVALVTVRPGAATTFDAITGHVREHLAGFKMPRGVEFRELPKTSIQKAELRQATRGSEVSSEPSSAPGPT